jgi:guanylate kinase
MMAEESRNSTEGILFVICGPSGVGKSTLRRQLIEHHDLAFSISATTRDPRPDEIDGVDYEFISKIEFEQRIARNQFIEWANVFDQLYGTPIKQLLDHVNAGQDVVLEIDVQGAQQIQQKKDEFNISVHFIFIAPPSLEELQERLINRRTNNPQDIDLRIREAEREISQADAFDRVVVNSEIETALAEIVKFIESVRRS